MRLHQVAYATQAHKDTGRAVGARIARPTSPVSRRPPCTRSGVRVVHRGDAQAARHRDHERAGPAAAAVRGRLRTGRELPGAAAVGRSPADHRGHLVRRRRLLRPDRRPGRHQGPRRAGAVPARRAGGAAGHHRPGRGVRQPTRKASPAARRAAAKKAAARHDAARKATAQKRAAVRTLVSRAANRPAPATPRQPANAPCRAETRRAAVGADDGRRARKQAAARPRPEAPRETAPLSPRPAPEPVEGQDAGQPSPPASAPKPRKKAAAKKSANG